MKTVIAALLMAAYMSASAHASSLEATHALDKFIVCHAQALKRTSIAQADFLCGTENDLATKLNGKPIVAAASRALDMTVGQ